VCSAKSHSSINIGKTTLIGRGASQLPPFCYYLPDYVTPQKCHRMREEILCSIAIEGVEFCKL
jgi:hypothetical protein